MAVYHHAAHWRLGPSYTYSCLPHSVVMHSELATTLDHTAASLTWTSRASHVIDSFRVQQNVHLGLTYQSPHPQSKRDLHKFIDTRAYSQIPRGGPEKSETSRDTPLDPRAPSQRSVAPFRLLPPSRLPSPCPWGWLETISTLLVYETLIHIPLGLGGLSIASALLGPQFLDPQMKAFCLLLFAFLESSASWLLFSSSLTPYKPFPPSWFTLWLSKGIYFWILPAGTTASLAAVGATRSLISLYLSPLAIDSSATTPLPSPLFDILSAGLPAQASIFLSIVIIAPIVEEFIYRGFLLPSIAAKIPLPVALLLSSLIFAVSHPNVGTWPELLSLGFVLGGVYCVSGHLAAPIGVHILYNAIVFGSQLIQVV